MDDKKDLSGTVTEFYPIRGYGYLQDERKREYCFYMEDLHMESRSVKKGDRVSFDVYVGHGVRAVNVRP